MRIIVLILTGAFSFLACSSSETNWETKANEEWYETDQSDRELVCATYNEINDDERFFYLMFEDDDAAPIERDQALMEIIKDRC